VREVRKAADLYSTKNKTKMAELPKDMHPYGELGLLLSWTSPAAEVDVILISFPSMGQSLDKDR
jgi:hypothetical protein